MAGGKLTLEQRTKVVLGFVIPILFLVALIAAVVVKLS